MAGAISSKARKNGKSLFRRVNEWLHLWLGLLSGIVVFVVCLTAAIWVFRDEVAYFTKPFNRIESQNNPFLRPSMLKSKARRYLDSAMTGEPMILYTLTYRGPDRTAYVGYLDTVKGVYMGYLHLSPYTGKVIHNEFFAESNTRNFFLFIRAGHRFFWLPRHIGSPFVGGCCIVFLITLVTGLIWWYPKKWVRSTRGKSFRIKWKAGWKRLNLDLHNVLGFYSLLFAFILTFTGVYYSFQWFQSGYHYLLGEREASGNTSPARPEPRDERSKNRHVQPAFPLDALWKKFYYGRGKPAGELTLAFPRDNISPFAVTYNPDRDRSYRMYTRYFDRSNLEELEAGGFDSRRSNQRFGELTVGQKVIRMNFDIHVGTIGGLPTKILACLASLIGASLPVTGFIIWYNRRWGGKKKGVARSLKKAASDPC